MKILKYATILSAFMLLSGSTQGALIVDYFSAASTTNATLSPNSANAAITATNFVAGSGLTAESGSSYNWRGWDIASTSFAAAVAANDTFSWGFTVNANSTVDLTTLDIRLDRSPTGPTDVEVKASVNGGASSSILIGTVSATGTNFVNNDLSSIVLLQGGDSIVFTLAAFKSTAAAGTFDLENFSTTSPGLAIFGDVTSVPVPEPSSLAMVGLSCMALGRRRRR